MSRAYQEGNDFTGLDFTLKALEKGEYENCTFRNCNFAETTLSDVIFTECTFEGCDFSMTKVGGASFRTVIFRNCKQLGVRFDECSKLLLSFTFENCILNFASFYKLKLKGTRFLGCKLQETDFTETDLTKAIFHDCNLQGSTFDRTILNEADLRTASNFSIDPENNQIKKAKFTLHGLAGLLDKYNIVIE
jgi:uncharacterized protein YjbI with pentapeptide repeats